MSEYLASIEVVRDWVNDLARRTAVYAPVRAGARSYRFDRVGKLATLELEAYRPTIVPPGKKLAPARDELFQFRRQDGAWKVESTFAREEQILVGVRPCDLRAIHLVDRAQRDGIADPHYLARREATTIVAVTCLAPCDERAFCRSTGALDHREGADVFLTPTADGVLVEALTPRGRALADGAGPGLRACADLGARRAAALAGRPARFGRELAREPAALPALLRDRWRARAWDDHVKRCFSCGTCTMVCPTCYCFDVRDETGLDLESGARARTWDSCMLPPFAAVAGGHNFRPDAAGRQRHRVKRKFEYLVDRFGEGSFCVGCGRCGRQCTSGIDIFDIVNDVVTGA